MSMPRSGWDQALAARSRSRDRVDELIDEFDDDGPVVCPQCMGPAALLGALGSVTHLRCVDCGWTFTEDEGLKEERS